MRTRYSILFYLVIFNGLLSCQDPTENNLVDGQSASDGMETIHVTSKITALMIAGRDFTATDWLSFPECTVNDTFVVDSTVFPFPMNIEFGNCEMGTYGLNVSGDCEIMNTGSMSISGNITQLTATDLIIDDWICSGIWQIKAIDETTFLLSTQEVNMVKGAVVVALDVGFEVNWVSGEESSSMKDDSFSITGTASGIDQQNRPFAVLVHSPLVLGANCTWISEGAMDVVPEESDRQTVDAGNGSCDGNFVISGNEYTGSFTL